MENVPLDMMRLLFIKGYKIKTEDTSDNGVFCHVLVWPGFPKQNKKEGLSYV